MQELKLINMADVQREEMSWLVEPYLPFGKISIVQGDPGTGKTTVMLAIAAALTCGGELPDGSFCEPANVIFQTAEDGLADTIKPRLEDMGADCSRVDVIDDSDNPLSFSDQRIEQAIVETGAKLFVADPAQAYFSDMNSAGGVRPMMKSLAMVAERTGCAIVIIGHLRKSKGKSAYRGLGSIDIYAAARSVLVVGKIDDYTRAVVQDKINVAAPGKSFSFELNPETGFKWLGECEANVDEVMSGKSQQLSQSDKAFQIIFSALSDSDIISANEIYKTATAGGVSIKTLKRAKSELGVVSLKRGDGWYWQLPNYGENKEGQNQGIQPCDDKTAFLTPLENQESESNLEEEISI